MAGGAKVPYGSGSTEGGIGTPSWKTGMTHPICAAACSEDAVSACAEALHRLSLCLIS